MAVAAALGGSSPNFDALYGEVTRLSKGLSKASPRESNDPSQSLKLTVLDTVTNQTQEFETYMRAFYGKEGDQVNYELYYKDSNNKERRITNLTLNPTTKNLQDQRVVLPNTDPTTGNAVTYRLNSQPIILNEQLVIDSTSGNILVNPGAPVGTNYNPTAVATNIILGLIKLDGVTGLDVGLINNRISDTNLSIEALNKVIQVASGNVEAAVNLRL